MTPVREAHIEIFCCILSLAACFVLHAQKVLSTAVQNAGGSLALYLLHSCAPSRILLQLKHGNSYRLSKPIIERLVISPASLQAQIMLFEPSCHPNWCTRAVHEAYAFVAIIGIGARTLAGLCSFATMYFPTSMNFNSRVQRQELFSVG